MFCAVFLYKCSFRTGANADMWAVDDVIVGGDTIPPNVVYDPLSSSPQSSAFLFWPGGRIDDFCARFEKKLSCSLQTPPVLS